MINIEELENFIINYYDEDHLHNIYNATQDYLQTLFNVIDNLINSNDLLKEQEVFIFKNTFIKNKNYNLTFKDCDKWQGITIILDEKNKIMIFQSLKAKDNLLDLLNNDEAQIRVNISKIKIQD